MKREIKTEGFGEGKGTLQILLYARPKTGS